MGCFAVSVGAVHNDSTVSVVSFNIAGTLKQKVRAALPTSATPPPKADLTIVVEEQLACNYYILICFQLLTLGLPLIFLYYRDRCQIQTIYYIYK